MPVEVDERLPRLPAQEVRRFFVHTEKSSRYPTFLLLFFARDGDESGTSRLVGLV